jgi:hypothetical protein
VVDSARMASVVHLDSDLVVSARTESRFVLLSDCLQYYAMLANESRLWWVLLARWLLNALQFVVVIFWFPRTCSWTRRWRPGVNGVNGVNGMSVAWAVI